MKPQLTLHHTGDSRAFEAHLPDGGVAGTLFFEPQGGRWRITHTEVEPEFEGQGVGSFLAKGVLDSAREKGVLVLPDCSFVQGYLSRHSEYVELVPDELRRGYGL